MADEREQVPLGDQARTAVPAAYLGELVASLNRPAQPNEALARAADRVRRLVIQSASSPARSAEGA